LRTQLYPPNFSGHFFFFQHWYIASSLQKPSSAIEKLLVV
jgi:hypothetical protein